MPDLITGIDHLLVSSRSFESDVADCERLLGTQARIETRDEGKPRATLAAGNLDLVIEAHASCQGLTGMCFATSDRARLLRRLKRLGMNPEGADSPTQGAEGDTPEPRAAVWLEPGDARGLKIGFMEQKERADRTEPSRILGLDHVVIATTDAEGTSFLLGSRLGLDLRMDLSNPAWGARLLFFRCGDLIIEVFQSLNSDAAAEPSETQVPGSGQDHFYGLSWRTGDAPGAQAALAELGVDVSPVRDGRKPGTCVFTVRDHTAGVATLMLAKVPT